jgi:hypothetical protein
MINIGTLVSAAIRPNSSLDPISSAYSNEILGGHHTYETMIERDSIIIERRQWGMLCTVYNDSSSSNNTTYVLKYNNVDTNLMNNSNWIEYSISGDSNSEWIDSVKSILLTEPTSPTDGDRYLLGLSNTDMPIGINWSLITGGSIAEWNGYSLVWDISQPTKGTSVRIDDEIFTIYNYINNDFPTGQWVKESLNQVRYIDASSIDDINYSGISNPNFNVYNEEILYLVKFSTDISGTSPYTLDINSLGSKVMKKPTKAGLVDLTIGDIKAGVIYNLNYDGTYFQVTSPYGGDSLNIKYYIEPGEVITVPVNHQYWVYGDLTIAGELINYGQVVIAEGGMILTGTGVFSNHGSLTLISIGEEINFQNSDTIEFSVVKDPITGSTVSASVSYSSLTASHLNTGTNGGATAGYLLSSDAAGNFKWVNNTSFGTVGGIPTVDDKNYMMSFDTSGDNASTGLFITNTPIDGSHVFITVNGQYFNVGDGISTSSSCYFSNDGGITAKEFASPNQITAGDELYWNGIVVGTDLYTSWSISIYYKI